MPTKQTEQKVSLPSPHLTICSSLAQNTQRRKKKSIYSIYVTLDEYVCMNIHINTYDPCRSSQNTHTHKITENYQNHWLKIDQGSKPPAWLRQFLCVCSKTQARKGQWEMQKPQINTYQCIAMSHCKHPFQTIEDIRQTTRKHTNTYRLHVVCREFHRAAVSGLSAGGGWCKTAHSLVSIRTRSSTTDAQSHHFHLPFSHYLVLKWTRPLTLPPGQMSISISSRSAH